VRLYNALGLPVRSIQQSALTMGLANGSRIISLPGDEKNIRGYSNVKLLVIDEAARVPDSLYLTIRPMLAVSRGRLICLSTPFGKRGWFHDAWTGSEEWERFPSHRRRMPTHYSRVPGRGTTGFGAGAGMAQEYQCSFEDAVDQIFAYEDIMAAIADDLKPLVVG